MNDRDREMLRDEFLEHARSRPELLEEPIAQYWKFLRAERGMNGPLLYISRPGRTVIHIKNVSLADRRWILIPETDPRRVGRVYELSVDVHVGCTRGDDAG